MLRTPRHPALLFIPILVAVASPAPAQAPPAVQAEREAFTDWLAHAPTAPSAALAQLPVSDSVRIGPQGSDLPIDSTGPLVISRQGGVLALTVTSGTRMLLRGRPVRVGRLTIVAGGPSDRPVVTVFDSSLVRKATGWYPYDPGLVFTGPLLPPARESSRLVLAPDGVEVEAYDAGTVVVPMAGRAVRLAVMRIPDPVTNESDLEIYFRDATNGSGTYPAGRFVSLRPAANGHWRLDFNRSRNPFCAYSSAYACPAPWRGNVVPDSVRAGERYLHPE